MRESDRLGSYWVREGGRLIKRERRGSETDVPKLYPTMNMNSLCLCDIPRILQNNQPHLLDQISVPFKYFVIAKFQSLTLLKVLFT